MHHPLVFAGGVAAVEGVNLERIPAKLVNGVEIGGWAQVVPRGRLERRRAGLVLYAQSGVSFAAAQAFLPVPFSPEGVGWHSKAPNTGKNACVTRTNW
jgi:hypothetical protein